MNYFYAIFPCSVYCWILFLPIGALQMAETKKIVKILFISYTLGQIWFWPQPVTAHENDIQEKNQKWEVQRLLQSWSEQRLLFFHNNISAGHTSLSGWSIIWTVYHETQNIKKYYKP